MYISVAAGNDFLDFRTPGLSYPAASPYVVPVASVGSDGKLSDFSQRSSRVLAAPGERITSTVPDYLYSFDGVPNDFAEATGTSMAAPYVAGASVLVREALQFVGYTDITQDTIYGYLRDTADMVYDDVTEQSYHRINLQATLDAIMPADEYGSTASAPQQLGTLAADTSLTGLIGRLDDTDYFRFTAGVTGVATVSATPADALQPQWQLIGAAGQFDGDSVTFDVLAGQTYTVGIGTSSGIGHYRLDVEIEQSIVDWGTVGHARSFGQSVQGEAWYRLATADDGVLVVEAAFSRALGEVDIELYSASGIRLAASAASATGQRLVYSVSAGQTYFVRATGTNASVEYRATHAGTAGAGSEAVLIDDFNNDGFADVLARATDGTWWLTTTTANGGTSQFWGRWSAAKQWSDVTTGDFDNDGRVDVIGRAQNGEWWIGRNTSTGLRNHLWGRWSGRVHWNDVSVGDFDQDGDLDLVGRTNWGEWWVAVNEGYRFSNRFWGRWSPRETWSDVTALDVDGDGDTDMIGRSGTGQWWLARSTAAGFVNEPWIQPATLASSGASPVRGVDTVLGDPAGLEELPDRTGTQQSQSAPPSDVGLVEHPRDDQSTPAGGLPTTDFDTNGQLGAVWASAVFPPSVQDSGTRPLREYRGVGAGPAGAASRGFDRPGGKEHSGDAAFASSEDWDFGLGATSGAADRGLRGFQAAGWATLADRLFAQYRTLRPAEGTTQD
jgi:hypothetical protein